MHFFDGDDFQRIVLAILDDHRHMARVFVRAFDYTYDPSVQSIFLHPPIYHRLPKTALQRWLSVFDLRRSTWRWFLANYEFGATAFAHTTDFIDYCALLGCSV